MTNMLLLKLKALLAAENTSTYKIWHSDTYPIVILCVNTNKTLVNDEGNWTMTIQQHKKQNE